MGNNDFIETGYLELILGPMFSGKSSKLIEIVRKYKLLRKSILILKPIIDNRYSNNSLIVTHDKITIDCISVESLSSITDVQKYDVIVIEEGQFFSDIYEKVSEWCKIKKVYVAGLNGDANQNLFGNLYKLISLADDILFLNALCMKCNDGTSAIFTKKNINNGQILEVGGPELYDAVCRKHLTVT
jgi:thymidine kinase